MIKYDCKEGDVDWAKKGSIDFGLPKVKSKVSPQIETQNEKAGSEINKMLDDLKSFANKELSDVKRSKNKNKDKDYLPDL